MSCEITIPASVAHSLEEIERSLKRFRSCYGLGTDPQQLLAQEIITMRVELLRLWSEVSAKCKKEEGTEGFHHRGTEGTKFG
jgi:hypothetical protein